MMPRTPDKTELMSKERGRTRAAEKIHEKARYLRGRFLNSVAVIERDIALILTDVSDEALSRPLEQGIGFVEWNTGKPVTDEEFEDWELKTTTVLECLSEIGITA